MIGQLFDASVRGAITHVGANGSSHSQVAAATADIAGGKGPGGMNTGISGVIPPGVATTVNILTASVAGTVLGFAVKLATGCAAAETLTIQLRKNATTLLAAGDLVVDQADGVTVQVAALTLVGADLGYVAGDLISMIVTQAGGAPPMAANLFGTVSFRNV